MLFDQTEHVRCRFRGGTDIKERPEDVTATRSNRFMLKQHNRRLVPTAVEADDWAFPPGPPQAGTGPFR
jgi:hypothetical protein